MDGNLSKFYLTPLSTPSYYVCLDTPEPIGNVCSVTADINNWLMVTIANNEDGSKKLRVAADRFWLSPSCDVQGIPMLSWVFTCLTVGYVEGDSTTFVGKVN